MFTVVSLIENVQELVEGLLYTNDFESAYDLIPAFWRASDAVTRRRKRAADGRPSTTLFF